MSYKRYLMVLLLYSRLFRHLQRQSQSSWCQLTKLRTHTVQTLGHLKHTHRHTAWNLCTFFKFKLYSSLNLSHPVCLPRHYQQPLPRFGLPWLQGGRRRRCGGGDGGRLRRLSGGCGRGGNWGGQLRSGGGGGVPVCGRQVQQDLIAPLPLVAFGALAGVGLLPLLAAVALAAVSMETGAAGTGVCEKLR